METYYADVLLPLHLPDTYTYRIPRELVGEVKVGVRVVVQFGQKRMYSAVVRRIHSVAPKWQCKYVIEVLDSEPVVSLRQMEFWEWMAGYYMCCVGDVMAVALPAGLKLASESTVSIHPDFDGELTRLSKYERLVVDLLTQHPVMKLDDISRALGIQKIMPLMHTMIERSVVIMDEELRQRFVPKKSTFVKLATPYATEESQRALLEELERKRSTRQVELLLLLLQKSHFGREAVAKRDLPQGSALQTLLKRGVLEQEERVISRIASGEATATVESIQLNAEQQAAFDYLSHGSDKSINLLHGVTSSGKTEVYIKLIADQVAQGAQTLFLLPEIALTAQAINRLRRYFGDLVGVYHSRFSASQRVEVWQGAASGRYKVLLGARSALFLPFQKLSLIIVDEEHDTSYKQHEPAPRYHARDSALYLASLWGARTVLGSATPSIESYHHATNGKYGLVKMQHRYGGHEMPTVECVDMKAAAQNKELKGPFSKVLLTAISEALANKEQAILFQNRRGFSLRLECDECHHVPQCINCDVSLVYHKSSGTLRCHYCGYSIPVPAECPACQSTRMRMTGIGTERVEEDLQIMLPEARVARMDIDSTQQKNQYLELLSDFADRKIDILVGTQMVTKGLDFGNVSVVGVVSADNAINFPNFRSYERAFQQLTQVSGRAGRRGGGGQVLIQTYNPNHHVLELVKQGDYESLFAEQDTERRVFRYPPYYRLIELTLKHREQEVLNAAAEWMAMQMRGAFGNRVMGPEYPLVSRVRGLYLKAITVRFERNEAIAQAKKLMMRMADDMNMQPGWKKVLTLFDVDPT
ncbi:MAG: primosomal protein N' [Bacteroidales bacterium]|nr:primosomal protein N' [Bacteroidales bacterium]